MTQHVLVIDDNVHDFYACEKALTAAGFDYSLSHTSTVSSALNQIKHKQITCVLLDYFLHGSDCRTNIKKINALSPYLPIVVLTGQGDELVAVDLLKAGAQDYILKSKLTGESLNTVIQESYASCQRDKLQAKRPHRKTTV